MADVVVVGASLAGLRAVEELRNRGHDGPITVVGAEDEAPYDRPPLSKELLAGETEADRIRLRPPPEDLEATWRLGAPASGLDTATRTVTLASGGEVGYDGLVVATGARPRPLPGTGEPAPAGLHTLRSLADAHALRADLAEAGRRDAPVVVIGAGFIGAEVAATCRRRGLAVTLVEVAEQPLLGALGAKVGGVIADLHRHHGTEVRCGTGVEAILTEDGPSGSDGPAPASTGRVRGVRLADRTEIEATVVVVGVGVEPNTDWLAGSGLTLDDGVVCDATCRAGPGVVAAGDVARWHNPTFGEVMRIEHWENAVVMGAHAAATLVAELSHDGAGAEHFAPVPWFWSDQFDATITLVGRPRPDDQTAVVTGALDEDRFVVLYGRDGRLRAALAMNKPAATIRYRFRIGDGLGWDEALEAAEDR